MGRRITCDFCGGLMEKEYSEHIEFEVKGVRIELQSNVTCYNKSGRMNLDVCGQCVRRLLSGEKPEPLAGWGNNSIGLNEEAGL